MPYAPSVARGYDGRAATTAALMRLLGRALEHTRSQKSTRRKRPIGKPGGADTSAATRGVRDWRQDDEKTRAKHHSSLASQASAFGTGGVSRAFLGWESRDCTRARGGGRFDILAKAAAEQAALVYRRPCAFSNRSFVVRAAQPNTRRHSPYTAPRHHSSARASKRLRTE